MTPLQELKAATAATMKTIYTRNILSVYYSASLADQQAGAAWYEGAQAIAVTLSETYGISVMQAAGVLAALSPRSEWGRNVMIAERYISACLATGRTAVAQGGYLEVGLIKVDKILALNTPTFEAVSIILNGNKVRAFFANIIGDLSKVCVDGHAYNIAENGMLRLGITQANEIKTPQYIILASAYEAAAHEVGVLPAVMQAITWVTYKAIEISK